MEPFVTQNSVVRTIWGKADTVLFIFAGSAAEFALNKAVDWLYYTGRLPVDPLGRLFSTVTYARQIIFSPYDDALKAIDKITAIHQGVEQSRGAKIPDWAYRDVLFMLIDYSIRSFEVLERELTDAEKQDVFEVFYNVGHRMQLTGLPQTYREWITMRAEHLNNDLIKSDFTSDLYKQYKKHLGTFRYKLVLQVQELIAPKIVSRMLGIDKFVWIKPVLDAYKVSRLLKVDRILKEALLPVKYKQQIRALDVG